MVRQSITLTGLNDKWLKAQIEKEEYTSKSEIVNVMWLYYSGHTT